MLLITPPGLETITNQLHPNRYSETVETVSMTTVVRSVEHQRLAEVSVVGYPRTEAILSMIVLRRRPAKLL